MTALQVTGLSLSYDGVHALRGVELSVEAGERRAIVGPNGAGKSTLFNVIGGQVRANGGTVTLFGSDVTRVPAWKRVRGGLSRTWQISNLFGALSVLETVKIAIAAATPARGVFWRSLDRYTDIADQAEELLERWGGLSRVKEELVQNLAYGDQRVLEIVVALACRPRVVLLDEPTAGLSPAEAEGVTDLLCGLPADISIVLIEHDMSVAYRVADSMSVLASGAVIASGDVDEVRQDPNVIKAYLGESDVTAH